VTSVEEKVDTEDRVADAREGETLKAVRTSVEEEVDSEDRSQTPERVRHLRPCEPDLEVVGEVGPSSAAQQPEVRGDIQQC